MVLHLSPLHTQKDLIKPCISLLSDEWPDGKFSRLEILEFNCPNPPCSVVLVSDEEGDKDFLIGHCRIVPIKNFENALKIELVVIDKRRRGRGLGRILLQMIEEHCAKQGYRTIFLASSPTIITQFYLRHGYTFTECRPHVVGSVMFDHGSQVPLSSPYPGWESYYKPYDGTVYSPKEQKSASCVVTAWQRPSNIQKAFDSNEQSATEDVQVPSWSLDIDGYCYFKKDI